MRSEIINSINPAKLIIGQMRSRVFKQNKNCNIIIEGESGSGKSWLNLSLLTLLIPNFKRMFRPCCVFYFKDLMNIINAKTRSGAHFLKKGYGFMFDEIGTKEGAYNRAWYSNNNQGLIELLQTYRHRNLIGTFTVPFKRLIDSQAIDFFQYRIKMVKIHEDINMSEAKIYRLSKGEKEPYNVYLRDKRGFVYKSFLFPKPPEWMINEYELMKQEFTTKLNKRLGESVNKGRVKKIKKFDSKKYVNKVLERIEFFKNTRGNIDWLKVKYEFNLSEPKAKIIKKYADNKLKNEWKEGLE